MFWDVTETLLNGLGTTFEIFIFTLLFSLPLGLIVSFGAMSKFKPLRYLVQIFTWIIRGTPLMLQLIIIFYGPGLWLGHNIWSGDEWGRISATVVAFTINYACYFSVIFRGGIEGVPAGQREAGQVLGMTKSQIFFKITLPAMSPSIFFAVVMTVISSFQVFDQTFVSTMGGPNNETNTMVLYLYNNAFKYQRLGYASAIAWVLFFCMLIITGILMKQQKRLVNYDS